MSSLRKFSHAPESGITPAAFTQMQYFHIFSFLDTNKGHDNVKNVIYEMIKIEFKKKYIYMRIYIPKRRREKCFNQRIHRSLYTLHSF